MVVITSNKTHMVAMAKVLYTISFFVLCISFPLTVVGQKASASSDSIQAVGHASPDTTASDRVHNAVYLELLGAGGLYSINYDRHIAGAWGVRAGWRLDCTSGWYDTNHACAFCLHAQCLPERARTRSGSDVLLG